MSCSSSHLDVAADPDGRYDNTTNHHANGYDNERVVDEDEQQLVEQIEENKTQLSFVKEQLDLDPENAELCQLQSNLVELIQLLEDELLNLKKAKLLAQISAQYDQQPIEIQEEQEDSNESLLSLIQEFNGQECAVPFVFQNGSIEYHDAILKVDDDQQFDTLKDVKLKAFFLYPLTDSMLTCPFYLRSSCKFSTTNSNSCKYSHGSLVTVNQIRPKISYCLSDQSTKQHHGNLVCLVRNSALPEESRVASAYDEKLWSRALVVRADEEKGQVLVRLARNHKDHWVVIEQLVMVDEEFKEEDEEQVDHHLNLQEEPTEAQILNSPEFGEWERYTNGIGSKLMAKMGYQLGQGLGSRSQGMVNPIQTMVFPPGKSLDTCFQLKQESEAKKTNIKEILKEKARKLKFEAKQARNYEKMDRKLKRSQDSVFGLLNDMFYSPSSSSLNVPGPSKPTVKPKPQMKSLDSKSLNLKAFQLDEELRKAEAELNKIESICRGKVGKADPSVVIHLEEKRKKLKLKVEALRRDQAELGKEKKQRMDKDKLRFF